MWRVVGWHFLMLGWLAGLFYGVWWAWPNFERMQLTMDLVISIAWLGLSFWIWVVVLQVGIRRYWRH